MAFYKRITVLSTNCGVVVCDLKDIHTKEDMEETE